MTAQGFHHGSRRSMFQPRRPPEVDQTPSPHTNASTGHQDKQFGDTVAKVSDSGLLDPPESTSSDADCDQVPSPAPDAINLRSPDPKRPYESDVSMKIPRVIRTYTRKIKHEPIVVKRKQHSLQNDEGLGREDRSEADADVETSERNKKKNRRKKRRAPVNQLALVARLPSPNGFKKSHSSDDIVNPLDGSTNKQESPTNTSPANSEKIRANVGKPVTRIRHEILLPQWEVLDRERFKVLPNTPRATRSPGWKLGSGFDGITLKPTNLRLRASRKRKLGRTSTTRTPHVAGPSLSELDFSAGSSPTHRFVRQRDISSKQQSHCGLELVENLDIAHGVLEGGPAQSTAKSCGESASELVATSTAPIHTLLRNDRSGTASSSHHGGILKGPPPLHPSQSRDLDASQTIREPSNSERNGWLKRRQVDFAVADEDEERLFARILTAPVHGSRERKESGRDGVDRYSKDTTQAQHLAGTDPQAFSKSRQTTQNPQRRVTSQKQGFVHDEPSAGLRRRRVSQDVAAGCSDSEESTSTHQGSNMPPQRQPSLQSEADFPASALHPPPHPSMPKAKSHIQIPRTSEIPETQEVAHERLNPDDQRSHPFHASETTLDAGGYFSNALRQLESPNTVLLPHTIARRKSRREPEQDPKGSSATSRVQRGVSSHQANVVGGKQATQKKQEEEEGVLQLGVTPRLKRKMSCVPFRPPFRESL